MAKTVLIVDDEEMIRSSLARFLSQWRIIHAGSLREAETGLDEHPDVCLLDIRLPDGDSLDSLARLRRISPSTEIVFMTGHGGVQEAVTAVKGGAYDFLTKPFDSLETVGIACERALEHKLLRERAERLEKEVEKRNGFEAVVGSSPILQKAISLAKDVAASASSVLLRGESGTGKEVFARAIHLASPRSKQPFVVVNCGALPEALIESELFGHMKGSFTGAVKDKRGLFEEAHGGTIFLDEIGEMPAQAQVRLLRVLQSGEVRRVGGNDARIVDVRVVAATNADLKAAIKAGSFREDLFYRLNVIGIELPPLRSRVDDIPLLATAFLRNAAKKAGKELAGFSDLAMNALLMWTWPGNVRELENTVERAAVVAKGKEVDVGDLPESLFATMKPLETKVIGDGQPTSYKEARDKALVEFERGYVSALLRVTEGNMADAAKMAGLDRSNFRKVVVRSGVDFRDFIPRKSSNG